MIRAAAVLCLAAASLLLPSLLPAARPFTVSDAVTMTRIDTGRQLMDSATAPNAFYPSPDGKLVLSIVRKGNLVTGLTEYELLVFDTDEVRDFVRATESAAAKTPFRPRKLLGFNTPGWAYGIDSLSWRDNQSVLFIGRGADGVGQVFTVDVGTGVLRQVTRHPEDIQKIFVSGNGRSLVYSALSPPEDWTERNARGYALTTRHRLVELYTKNPEDMWRCCRQFILDVETGSVVDIATPPVYLPPNFWLSPTGRWSVARVVLTTDYPAHWRDYAVVEAARLPTRPVQGSATEQAQSGDADGLDGVPIGVNQYLLIDMKTGATRPLLDAPIGLSGGTSHVVWSADETNVLIAPSYLSLAGTDQREREHRRRFAAVVDVDVASGGATRVTDILQGLSSTELVDVVRIQRAGKRSVVIQRRVGWPGELLPLERYTFEAGRWRQERRPNVPSTAPVASTPPEFFIAQDLNTPPEIAARDTGRARVLTNLNPQLRDVTFGRAEVFEWQDRLGRTHVGGLLRPPNYQAGRRYPVVIQTYGFKHDQFLLEGPPLAGKGAFAAQAIANKGIVVLQMPREEVSPRVEALSGPYEDWGEMPRFNAMLESAIDALDSRGIIDRNRVGLTGFSRSGTQVLGALTFWKYPIAAATVADGAAITPYAYVQDYAAGAFMSSSEREMGGAPWGEGIKLWLERSPAFHYDRVRTPLRLETYGRWADQRWDTYVMLRRFQRPVELIHLPDGVHILIPPWAVYASQQGTVDWYAFWLKDEEDPAPEKAEQYSRWRKLRKQHEAHLAEALSDSSSTVRQVR